MNLLIESPAAKQAGRSSKSKTHRFIITMLLLSVISLTTYGQSPEVRKAYRLIDIEQPSKGMAALEQLVSADPNNSNNLYYLGLAQLRMGDKDKALANFEKGIAANEKDGLNYAGKGHVRLVEKNPTDAKVQMDQALKVSKSKDAQVLKAVATGYLTDTKYLLDAINTINKALTINNGDPDLHILLGDALLLQNKQNAGPTVSAYEKAARADAKMAKPHYKVGKIYQQARSNDIAIASFEKAIEVDAEYAPAYKELGQVAYTNKEAAKAVQMYEKYLALSETPGDAKFQYAFFLFMAKDYQKANAIFKEVTTNPNVSPVALRYYAYSLTEQAKDGKDTTKSAEAEAAFAKYFQRAKQEEIQATDYAYYGKLLIEKKPSEDSLANEYFAKSLELDSAQADVLQMHGDTYLKRLKFDKAVEAYEQLISIRTQPLSQDLWSVGRAYYYNEEFHKADTAFTKLAERQPNMTIGYAWAAKARQQIDSTGALGLANPMFEKVIEKGVTNPEKYKKDLIDAYEYLGSYYINIKEDAVKAVDYYKKILELDPNHADAQKVLKAIKAG
jgi:tetratricopeptide (TPR) repeat protein